MYWIGAIFAVVIVWAVLMRVIGPKKPLDLGEVNPIAKGGLTVVGVGLIIFCFTAISVVWVGENEVGQLSKKYGSASLKDGRQIATDGEMGQQADVLPPGFHLMPFVRLTHSVALEPIIEVKPGECAILSAKDGEPLNGANFAEAFPAGEENQMVTDARYFLTHHGKKGQQTTVLKPGKYRLNTFLWDVKNGQPAVHIEAGQVGVVNSRVHSRVDMGNLKVEKPADTTARKEATVDGTLTADLVPVGAIGIWKDTLEPGLYYVNADAYKITPMNTKVDSLEYKGGYTRRSIKLEVDGKGQVTSTSTEEKIEMPQGATDRAIAVKPEGWEIYVEGRVQIQVTPQKAALVHAAVGSLEAIEKNVVTPAFRSVVRNVANGGTITVTDEKGNKQTRPVQALDFLNNRAAIEVAIQDAMRIEGEKAGVTIQEVRLGDSILPPELTLGKQRTQLAEQMSTAFKQEELAQTQRVAAENAKAKADQQGTLVAAQISVESSKQLAEAAKNEGEGQKQKLIAIADGQKAQADVLGKDKVMTLKVIEEVMKFLDAHPTVATSFAEHMPDFVPQRVVTVGAEHGASFNGAAAILGELLGTSNPPPEPAKPTSGKQ